MAHLIPDEFDFSAYLRDTEGRAKVRKASDFAADMVRRFAPADPKQRKPEMFSTKLRGRIEFRPGEVTTWAGYNGHKKSMFTGQLALDLCVQRQRVLMISLEMAPADTLARMAQQAFGVDSPATPSLERFAQWTDDRLWLFDHLGRLKPEKCMAVVRYFAEEMKGQHVFIDSMMMVCESEEHIDQQKQFATDMVRAAQEYGLHLHIITHCRKPSTGEGTPPTKYDIKGSGAISDQFHNVVMVWVNKPKFWALEKDATDTRAAQEPDMRIVVEKQRNGKWEGALKLWFHAASLRFTDEERVNVEPYVLRTE